MSHSLSEDENRIAEDQSPFCDGFAEKDDLIFSYPIEFINKTHAYTIASTLQRAMNYLKSVTNLKPTEKLRSRVIIRWIKERDLTGKSIWKSEKDANGNLIGHYINLSWDYMFKPCEPFRICAHELVHPFYRISPLHERTEGCVGNECWLGNEGWGEGFCDFMRGPVINSTELPGQQGSEWWQKMIEAAKNNKPGTHQNPAGQFVQKYLKYCGTDANSLSKFIDDDNLIRRFIRDLFEEFGCRPLKSELTPTYEMIKKYRLNRL